jgi:hypothetical protein
VGSYGDGWPLQIPQQMHVDVDDAAAADDDEDDDVADVGIGDGFDDAPRLHHPFPHSPQEPPDSHCCDCDCDDDGDGDNDDDDCTPLLHHRAWNYCRSLLGIGAACGPYYSNVNSRVKMGGQWGDSLQLGV